MDILNKLSRGYEYVLYELAGMGNSLKLFFNNINF